jgi:hypothetical protein
VVDERARYFRTLRRLRRSARRWSVLGFGLGGAAAVLTPYAGIGLPDAVWAAAAGGSIALACWRWADFRTALAQPVPPPPDPALTRTRMVQAIESVPIGRTAIAEMRRQRARAGVRGSVAVSSWDRLDRASAALRGLGERLNGPGDDAMLEAHVAEQSLRDLANRVAGIERAIRVAPADARPGLDEAHRDLARQLDEGVGAYERLVAAAAGYVAEDGRIGSEHPSVSRLTEASELLRNISIGLAELRRPAADPLHG